MNRRLMNSFVYALVNAAAAAGKISLLLILGEGRAKGVATFEKLGCPFFLSNYSGHRRREEMNAQGRCPHTEGCPPPQPTRGLGSVVSSQAGSGAEPRRQTISGVSCAILCDFTHLLRHLTAA